MDPPAVASRRPWETLRFGPRRVVLPPHVEFTTTLRPASSPSCAVPASEICRVCCPPPTFRFAKHPPREDRRFAAPVHPPRVGRPPTRRLVARRSRRACGHCSSFHDVGTNTPVARRRTARRCAAAPSGSCDPQRPGCGQHHRLVGHARVNRRVAPRCSSPATRHHAARGHVARRRVARSSSLATSMLVAVARHSSLVARRSPLRCPWNVARWPNSCSSGRRSLLVARCRRSPPAAAVQPPSS